MISVRAYLIIRKMRRNSGFSLLEILIASLVLAIAVSGILSLFTVGTDMHRRAQDQSMVSLATKAVISELDARMFAPPKEIKDQPVPGFDGFTYSAIFKPIGVLQPALPSETSAAYEVKVTIKWKYIGQDQKKEFTIFLLRKISDPR